MGHLVGDFHRGIVNVISEFRMAPIGRINLFTNLAIRPLPRILSSRHSIVVRAGGTAPIMGLGAIGGN